MGSINGSTVYFLSSQKQSFWLHFWLTKEMFKGRGDEEVKLGIVYTNGIYLKKSVVEWQ